MRFSFVLIATLITSAIVQAQPAANKAKAKESYRLASQSYDLGEYRDALTKFKEAYRYYEEPTFLFNIAQCHRQLGERQEAIRFFRTYLIKKPDAPNRADVEQMIARLEAEEKSKRPIAASSPPQPASTPSDIPAVTQSAAPAPAAPTPSVSASPPPKKTPIYKKWWLWTIVGVAVAGGAAGLAIGLSQPSTPTAATSFGNTSPF